MWLTKIFWILWLFPVSLVAQDLHFPEEIKKIMKESNVSFENRALEKPYGLATYSLLFNNYVFESEAAKPVLNGYSSNAEFLENISWKEAAHFVNEGQYKKARKLLIKLIANNQEHVPAFILLGEIELIEENLTMAQQWLEKALKKDNRSSRALWKLGELYCTQGYLKLGSDHILRAHMLNRNNPELFTRLQEVILERGIEFNNFDLVPKYTLERGEGGSIRINATEKPWIAYGNCKALWKYDVDYNSRFPDFMPQDFCMVEEKESLTNALIEYENLTTSTKEIDYPGIQAFKSSINDHSVNEYIFYEIWLKDDPALAQNLSEKELENLIEYFNAVRLNKP